jgi:hypothetical protein
VRVRSVTVAAAFARWCRRSRRPTAHGADSVAGSHHEARSSENSRRRCAVQERCDAQAEGNQSLAWDTASVPGLPDRVGLGNDALLLRLFDRAAALDDAPSGGVQLDVQPWRASVFVDDVYVGRVGDFSGYYKHLEVLAGPHRIVVVEPGYEPLVIDVDVVPGQTRTYRSTLTR